MFADDDLRLPHGPCQSLGPRVRMTRSEGSRGGGTARRSYGGPGPHG